MPFCSIVKDAVLSGYDFTFEISNENEFEIISFFLFSEVSRLWSFFSVLKLLLKVAFSNKDLTYFFGTSTNFGFSYPTNILINYLFKLGKSWETFNN